MALSAGRWASPPLLCLGKLHSKFIQNDCDGHQQQWHHGSQAQPTALAWATGCCRISREQTPACPGHQSHTRRPGPLQYKGRLGPSNPSRFPVGSAGLRLLLPRGLNSGTGPSRACPPPRAAPGPVSPSSMVSMGPRDQEAVTAQLYLCRGLGAGPQPHLLPLPGEAPPSLLNPLNGDSQQPHLHAGPQLLSIFKVLLNVDY